MQVRRLIAAVAVLAASIPYTARAQEESPPDRVVVLHSYHVGFTWSDSITDGIRSRFEAERPGVELCFEYLDARRFSTPRYFAGMAAHLKLKYAQRPVDVVIASDDHAFQFMLAYGENVFGNAPTVFCSVSGYQPGMRQGRQLTGLRESLAIEPTLRTAMDLHPETQKVFVITDLTATGRALRNKVEAVERRMPELTFLYAEDNSVSALQKQLPTLGDDTIVLLFILGPDEEGRVFSHEYNLERLAPYCPRPIYSVWQFYLGHGIVGGVLTPGEIEGSKAADMAMQTMSGTPASDIPLQTSPSVPMFDYRELVRFGIGPAALPDDSEIVNRPLSFYRAYRGTIWTALIIMVLMAAAIVVLLFNVNRRRQAEARVRQSEQDLAITLNSIGDAVISTDIHADVVRLNPVAEELTGWRAADAAGRPLAEVFKIVSALDGKTMENPAERVMREGRVVGLANHTTLISKDGSQYQIADSGAPIRDARGEMTGVVLVFRDVTKEYAAQDALQRMQKLESLGTLAGGIAHDFNNLLVGIFGCLDLVDESENEEEAAGYMATARGTINRARDLTRQLVTFAKGGAPVTEIGKLWPFIEEVTRFALSGSNCSYRFDIPDDLWPCRFDKNQIGQVIDNIVINALQAMPEGGVVDIRAANRSLQLDDHPVLEPGNYVKISISDQGEGMSEETKARAFDPFFTTKPDGRGLGLATSYSIVQRHGGSIDLESEPGEGSVFHIWLPASPDTIVEAKPVDATQHTGAGTFIVMDDEEIVRIIADRTLDKLGYHVITVQDGQAAIDAFMAEREAGRHIAGMILDLTIPGGMGGKATVDAIRKVDQDVPVFVSTGYSDSPVVADPGAYGFTASIGKPFNKAELTEILDKYVKQEP